MKTFEELGLCPELRSAIEELGFEAPMPVQEEVIPVLLNDGHDIIALAQTGTGKTATFGLPLLQRGGRAVVLSPTRELCVQIASDLQTYGKYMEERRIVCVYGGANIYPQIKELERGADIIVATPGRLIDLIERGAADLSDISTVVLDEADEMLNMGFSESIDRILEEVPETRTTWLFSATMSKEVEKIARRYLQGHREIVVGSRNEGAERVNHIAYVVKAADKYRALKRLVDFHPQIFAIIFCRTRRETGEVAEQLIRDGYNAEALHGDLSQTQRDQTMLKFREHRTQLLVATDVAARGLDVDDLTHVINYGLPDDVENYTHRSGRTGRAGKRGTSLSIIHVKEKGKVRMIERTIGKDFEWGTLPDPQDICQRQLFRVIDQLEKTEVDEEQIAPFIREVMAKLEWLSKEDIVKRLVQQEFGRFVAYYAKEAPIGSPERGEKNDSTRSRRKKGDNSDTQSSRSREPRGVELGYTRLYLNLGKKDKFYARDVISLVNRFVRGRVDIGHIELQDRYSLFEVPNEDARMVVNLMAKAKAGDRRVIVKVDGEHAGREMSKKEVRRQRNSDRKKAKKAKDENRRAKQFSQDDWKQFFN
ncbi:MAG: DEAD/DEAH box helicase [Bacteroidaceae bacterium]|nr:DEAD/DEAH box helicase [Bacteroidaceae bacterium]